jgi:hypothetical protein
MSAIVLYMSVSLDRFIAGPNEDLFGLGDCGHPPARLGLQCESTRSRCSSARQQPGVRRAEGHRRARRWQGTFAIPMAGATTTAKACGSGASAAASLAST